MTEGQHQAAPWPQTRAKLQRLLDSQENPIAAFRQALREGTEHLFARYDEGVPVGDLVQARSLLVDMLLGKAWKRHMPANAGAALAAVGGYGRQELHPGSDVDIMILLEHSEQESLRPALEALVTFLWDIGLEVGHSVRTLEECVHEARDDVTVVTNLIEARLLSGSSELFDRMRTATGPERIWPSEAFFAAKMQEQKTRWHKYGDTAYNLEPNIKENPGGLRDIQMIGWVAKRHFGAETLHDLVTHGFLTEGEHLTLLEGQALLWSIRFALHRLSGRREDRLLFDYQRTLAEQFGYSDRDDNLAVEQFMQHYYRTVMELNRLNEMLLQLFQEAILLHDQLDAPIPINKRFQVPQRLPGGHAGRHLSAQPGGPAGGFLHPADASGTRGCAGQHHPPDPRAPPPHRRHASRRTCAPAACSWRSCATRRASLALRAHEPLRRPGRLYPGVRQHRRAHAVRPLPRLHGGRAHPVRAAQPAPLHGTRACQGVPLCSAIARTIPKLELLYLAGLFHDIAKGRGGDHSLIGSRDAWDFCQLHGLSDYDSRLVAWLVEKHLIMSMTAQRKDISDPEVIQEFAAQIGDPTRLDYLYLLTVADARATNPQRWNSWKDSLLRDLYHATRRALVRGLDNPQAQDDLIQQKQTEALRLLSKYGVTSDACKALWIKFSLDYFLHNSPDEIAWQTRTLLGAADDVLPLVAIRPLTHRGGTEIFIYTQDREHLFARTTALLDRWGMSIMDARIMTTDDGMALNAYYVLEMTGSSPVLDEEHVVQIKQALVDELSGREAPDLQVTRPVPRQLRHFPTETKLSFSADKRNHRTVMRLVTLDRPGLLAEVGAIFDACGIRLQNAKIATVGAEADDVFFITAADQTPNIDKATLDCLREEIHRRLEDTAEA